MTEENNEETPEHKEPEHKEPDVTPLPDLDKITPKHLADLERKLRDEITQLHGSHSTEVTELREQLSELQEYKDSQEKAQGDRDKVKGSESTMVLPPNDIPPQQPQAPKPDELKKQSMWKKMW